MTFVKIKVPDERVNLIKKISKLSDEDILFLEQLLEHKEDKVLQEYALRKFIDETKDEDEIWEYYR